MKPAILWFWGPNHQTHPGFDRGQTSQILLHFMVWHDSMSMRVWPPFKCHETFKIFHFQGMVSLSKFAIAFLTLPILSPSLCTLAFPCTICITHGSVRIPQVPCPNILASTIHHPRSIGMKLSLDHHLVLSTSMLHPTIAYRKPRDFSHSTVVNHSTSKGDHDWFSLSLGPSIAMVVHKTEDYVEYHLSSLLRCAVSEVMHGITLISLHEINRDCFI